MNSSVFKVALKESWGPVTRAGTKPSMSRDTIRSSKDRGISSLDSASCAYMDQEAKDKGFGVQISQGLKSKSKYHGTAGNVWAKRREALLHATTREFFKREEGGRSSVLR